MKPTNHIPAKSGKDTIRIVVIDNDDIVCSAICSDLEKDDRFEAIGVNPDTQAALERVKREQPHVILLDLMWNNSRGAGGTCCLRSPEIAHTQQSSLFPREPNWRM